MSGIAVWRVVALGAPAWVRPCPGCLDSNAPFLATDRFRVNANGSRLDVWLLYACPKCGATEKRRLHHRTPVGAIDPARLDGYHRNDAALAWSHAFELAVRDELPHRVERPPLPAAGTLVATIEQPHPCGVRWDRLLARELGWSRARATSAWRRGELAIDGVRSLADRVADGRVVRVVLR
jgi:hypothetical protein